MCELDSSYSCDLRCFGFDTSDWTNSIACVYNTVSEYKICFLHVIGFFFKINLHKLMIVSFCGAYDCIESLLF